MLYTEFIALAEGKKRKFKDELRNWYHRGTDEIGRHVAVVKQPTTYDSLDDMVKTYGGGSIKRTMNQRVKDYHKRKEARVKELVKSYKKSK